MTSGYVANHREAFHCFLANQYNSSVQQLHHAANSDHGNLDLQQWAGRNNVVLDFWKGAIKGEAILDRLRGVEVKDSVISRWNIAVGLWYRGLLDDAVHMLEPIIEGKMTTEVATSTVDGRQILAEQMFFRVRARLLAAECVAMKGQIPRMYVLLGSTTEGKDLQKDLKKTLYAEADWVMLFGGRQEAERKPLKWSINAQIKVLLARAHLVNGDVEAATASLRELDQKTKEKKKIELFPRQRSLVYDIRARLAAMKGMFDVAMDWSEKITSGIGLDDVLRAAYYAGVAKLMNYNISIATSEPDVKDVAMTAVYHNSVLGYLCHQETKYATAAGYFVKARKLAEVINKMPPQFEEEEEMEEWEKLLLYSDDEEEHERKKPVPAPPKLDLTPVIDYNLNQSLAKLHSLPPASVSYPETLCTAFLPRCVPPAIRQVIETLPVVASTQPLEIPLGQFNTLHTVPRAAQAVPPPALQSLAEFLHKPPEGTPTSHLNAGILVLMHALTLLNLPDRVLRLSRQLSHPLTSTQTHLANLYTTRALLLLPPSVSVSILSDLDPTLIFPPLPNLPNPTSQTPPPPHPDHVPPAWQTLHAVQANPPSDPRLLRILRNNQRICEALWARMADPLSDTALKYHGQDDRGATEQQKSEDVRFRFWQMLSTMPDRSKTNYTGLGDLLGGYAHGRIKKKDNNNKSTSTSAAALGPPRAGSLQFPSMGEVPILQEQGQQSGQGWSQRDDGSRPVHDPVNDLDTNPQEVARQLGFNVEKGKWNKKK
ncbi:hypothetical protein HDU85_001611 [Gaertneriomyces sp. JEL0708]|nr:hypothetical protein HDU85_001611 [Gaertneriomyces sp. JEL0708]